MRSKNKILRDFWETQSLKNGLNRRFWKKIARLWLRHLRFESLLRAKRVTRLSGPIQNLWFCKWVMFLLRVYNVNKPVTSFCQVFKVEICKAITTVTWQVDIICHKKELKIQFFFLLYIIKKRRISTTLLSCSEDGARERYSIICCTFSFCW